MPGFIDRHEVRRLLDEEDAQLVDVLPGRAFQHARLPGAVSAPLVRFGNGVLDQLDRDVPVIVYCGGFL